MKANESIANYDIKVREYTNYAIESIKNVCKNFGPRPVGSEAEQKAQEYMLADLEKWCDAAVHLYYGHQADYGFLEYPARDGTGH